MIALYICLGILGAFLLFYVFPTLLISNIIYTVLFVRNKKDKWGREVSWDEPEQKNAPVIDKSVMPEILKVFSTSELDKLSSLSRDQAAEVVKLVDDFLSEK